MKDHTNTSPSPGQRIFRNEPGSSSASFPDSKYYSPREYSALCNDFSTSEIHSKDLVSFCKSAESHAPKPIEPENGEFKNPFPSIEVGLANELKNMMVQEASASSSSQISRSKGPFRSTDPPYYLARKRIFLESKACFNSALLNAVEASFRETCYVAERTLVGNFSFTDNHGNVLDLTARRGHKTAEQAPLGEAGNTVPASYGAARNSRHHVGYAATDATSSSTGYSSIHALEQKKNVLLAN